jgi:hypothetical protein
VKSLKTGENGIMSNHYHVVYTFVDNDEAHNFRDLVHKLLGYPKPMLRGQIRICKEVNHD